MGGRKVYHAERDRIGKGIGKEKTEKGSKGREVKMQGKGKNI